MADWRSIEDDREKYAAYLCSREWAVKREAVRERSGGKCERCHVLPMDHVHHLTYERKYREELEDLQASCKPCHEFTHGKSNDDPMSFPYERLLRYMADCTNRRGKPPCPFTLMMNGPQVLVPELRAPVVSIDILLAWVRQVDCAVPEATFDDIPSLIHDIVVDKVDEMLPFDYAVFARGIGRLIDIAGAQREYSTALYWLGISGESKEWFCSEEDRDG